MPQGGPQGTQPDYLIAPRPPRPAWPLGSRAGFFGFFSGLPWSLPGSSPVFPGLSLVLLWSSCCCLLVLAGFGLLLAGSRCCPWLLFPTGSRLVLGWFPASPWPSLVLAGSPWVCLILAVLPGSRSCVCWFSLHPQCCITKRCLKKHRGSGSRPMFQAQWLL